jgi:hypothetical protein
MSASRAHRAILVRLPDPDCGLERYMALANLVLRGLRCAVPRGPTEDGMHTA